LLKQRSQAYNLVGICGISDTFQRFATSLCRSGYASGVFAAVSNHCKRVSKQMSHVLNVCCSSPSAKASIAFRTCGCGCSCLSTLFIGELLSFLPHRTLVRCQRFFFSSGVSLAQGGSYCTPVSLHFCCSCTSPSFTTDAPCNVLLLVHRM